MAELLQTSAKDFLLDRYARQLAAFSLLSKEERSAIEEKTDEEIAKESQLLEGIAADLELHTASNDPTKDAVWFALLGSPLIQAISGFARDCKIVIQTDENTNLDIQIYDRD